MMFCAHARQKARIESSIGSKPTFGGIILTGDHPVAASSILAADLAR
jgi:hypothetical protein